MNLNMVGPFVVNHPYGTEIAFAKGLRRIGCSVNEIDPNLRDSWDRLDRFADATIVFKSCLGDEAMLQGLEGPVILYQPDDARFPHIRDMIRRMRPYASIFLSFTDHGSNFARSIGFQHAQTMLLTADDELYSPSDVPVERDIDVSFIGSLGDPIAHSSRRTMLQIVSELARQKGWNIFYRSTMVIPEILDVYRRSKVVLNHATDVGQPFGYGFGLQCRHFEVGMTNTCLLTNSLMDDDADFNLTPPTFHDAESLRKNLTMLVESPKVAEAIAWQTYTDIRDFHMPQHRAAELVKLIKDFS